ncbi:DUF2795 domain-containing protein [Streptomyces sp. 6N223]|uniref:DUF2795 domain-containing protein n=1 Tax=Streptomyces sp. 6N223 TaxID=3457412 RepID=UPI003FD539F4
MQQRGSDRLNVHRDDEMKHELGDRLRAERTSRAEEWRDPEPSAEDDPELARGPVPPRGDASTREAEDEAFRFELARHLRRTVYPARRRELLRVLQEENAPDPLIEAVRGLPPTDTYANVQAVAEALGHGPRR